MWLKSKYLRSYLVIQHNASIVLNCFGALTPFTQSTFLKLCGMSTQKVLNQSFYGFFKIKGNIIYWRLDRFQPILYKINIFRRYQSEKSFQKWLTAAAMYRISDNCKCGSCMRRHPPTHHKPLNIYIFFKLIFISIPQKKY